MGIEKDTTFKYIGKDYIDLLLELSDLPEDVDLENLKEVTVEMETLEISQFRPDFIVKNNKVIIMFEFESSYLSTPTKKRFLTYLALYDYKYNEDDLDIYFVVITNKGESKVVPHKINGTVEFNIRVVNINDFGFEKIINNTKTKIKNKEVFTGYELVKLALTSLMPKKKFEIKNQFYWLRDRIDEIIFEDDDARTSFIGIVILLSNSYFDKDDDIRKEIQGDFMNKVDSIAERMEEMYQQGCDDTIKKEKQKWINMGKEDATEAKGIKIGIKMLEENNPIDKVSKIVEIPIARLKAEYDKYLKEKNSTSV